VTDIRVRARSHQNPEETTRSHPAPGRATSQQEKAVARPAVRRAAGAPPIVAQALAGRSVALTEGSYIRAAQLAALRPYARVIAIPARRGSTVHGVAFVSNMVLHSGIDDGNGHFVVAYGIEAGAFADRQRLG
jgi:hypothetical protein